MSAEMDGSYSPVILVREWYERVPKPMRPRPTLDVPSAEVKLIESLLNEELGELTAALADKDVVRVADALADVVYVAYGAALQFGLDLDAVLAEVHRANMSKTNAEGKFMTGREGKVMRGDNYQPPDLEAALKLSRDEDGASS